MLLDAVHLTYCIQLVLFCFIVKLNCERFSILEQAPVKRQHQLKLLHVALSPPGVAIASHLLPFLFQTPH